MNVDFKELIEVISGYNPDEVENVTKAYMYAKEKHAGQMRESGEEYIIHPINVCYILANMHADKDTLCAALLHDVLEDSRLAKENYESAKKEMIDLFGESVTSLVEGVTKLAKMNFSTKDDQIAFNTRKIITSIITDTRIIIIKLADRLHNMRTLQYKKEYKQRENSIETLELYVPLAYRLGLYLVKAELEDLSFRYLKPDKYFELQTEINGFANNNREGIDLMLKKINDRFSEEDINHYIKVRIKNVYGVYNRLKEGEKLFDIHDLVAFKIIVDDIKNCYYSLYLIHDLFPLVDGRIKDFITKPKTNMYQSIHTTVYGSGNRLYQMQLRTYEMDQIAKRGFTTYWDKNKGKAGEEMQKALATKFQFFHSLCELDKYCKDNGEFIKTAKRELLGNNIYVTNSDGRVVELPVNATVADFILVNNQNSLFLISTIYVNDSEVNLNHPLNNKDRVRLVINENIAGNIDEIVNNATSNVSKTLIKELKR